MEYGTASNPMYWYVEHFASKIFESPALNNAAKIGYFEDI